MYSVSKESDMCLRCKQANMSELIQTQKQLLGFGLNIISHDRHLVRRGHVSTVNLAGKRSDKYAFLVSVQFLIIVLFN